MTSGRSGPPSVLLPPARAFSSDSFASSCCGLGSDGAAARARAAWASLTLGRDSAPPELILIRLVEAEACCKTSFKVGRFFMGILAAGVVHLFDARCPAAIIRRVTEVIFNPINGMARGRFRSHVRNKPDRIISPFGANGDALFSVIAPSTVLRVVAPLYHVAPSCIDGVFSGEAMLQTAGAGQLPRKASAALCQSIAQPGSVCDCCATARAKAEPISLSCKNHFHPPTHL